MLAFMVTSNSSVTIVYNEGIAKIQFYILMIYYGLISSIDTRKYYQYLC